MIEGITGKPGNGKTQLVMADLYDRWRAGTIDRPVYVSGIDIQESAMPLQTLEDPEQWMECPDGSWIIIDEAQRVFRPRGPSARVPDHVAALETHRHRGIDITWISQHPRLVDPALRRLTERHRHVYRRYGMRQSTVAEYQTCPDDPEPGGDRSSAVRSTFRFRPEVEAAYRSATVHTHQARPPRRLIALGLLGVIAVGGGMTYAVTSFMSRADADSDAEPPVVEEVDSSGVLAGVFGEPVEVIDEPVDEPVDEPCRSGQYVLESYIETLPGVQGYGIWRRVGESGPMRYRAVDLGYAEQSTAAMVSMYDGACRVGRGGR